MQLTTTTITGRMKHFIAQVCCYYNKLTKQYWTIKLIAANLIELMLSQSES